MKDKLKFLVKNNIYTILFVLIGMVYLINLFIDIMDIDAAQYALISMEMGWTKSFLEVYQYGKDYLDKPPLHFWLSSLSILAFGINNFAYKIPSVIIAVLGIYSTYRFTNLYYKNEEKAKLAALILASSQALFLITNDIRTDTNLLGLTIFSVWQIAEFIKGNTWKNLILASIGIGFAMMAKGPIAIVIVGLAFGTEFILKKQWSNIFKYQWLILLLIVCITLIPMSYGLYTQFDLHPEKIVHGIQNTSGLRFFYWTQSFGRITGESTWNNGAGFFFFFHTILWDFQPWIFLFIAALVVKTISFKRNNFKIDKNKEYISLGGFALVFLALSLSKFKLPHYIFVTLPFAAIITSDYLIEVKTKTQKRIANIQFGVMHLFWLIIIIGYSIVLPGRHLLLPLLFIILYLLFLFIFRNYKNKQQNVYLPTIITAISFNLFMALSFYPWLLSYQSSSQAAKFINVNKAKKNKVYTLNTKSYSFDYYSKNITPIIDSNNIKKIEKGSWVFTDHKGKEKLLKEGVKFEMIETLNHFKVTRLSIGFINPQTRELNLEKKYILKIL